MEQELWKYKICILSSYIHGTILKLLERKEIPKMNRAARAQARRWAEAIKARVQCNQEPGTADESSY